jgi:hypothetical protein
MAANHKFAAGNSLSTANHKFVAGHTFGSECKFATNNSISAVNYNFAAEHTCIFNSNTYIIKYQQRITNSLQNTHAFSIPEHICHQIPAKSHDFNMNTHMHLLTQCIPANLIVVASPLPSFILSILFIILS